MAAPSRNSASGTADAVAGRLAPGRTSSSRRSRTGNGRPDSSPWKAYSTRSCAWSRSPSALSSAYCTSRRFLAVVVMLQYLPTCASAPSSMTEPTDASAMLLPAGLNGLRQSTNELLKLVGGDFTLDSDGDGAFVVLSLGTAHAVASSDLQAARSAWPPAERRRGPSRVQSCRADARCRRRGCRIQAAPRHRPGDRRQRQSTFRLAPAGRRFSRRPGHPGPRPAA